MDVAEGLFGLLEDRAPVLGEQVLREVGDTYTRGDVDLATGSLTRATEDLEQGALARPVLAHQGDTILGVDDEGNIGEERSPTYLYGETID